MYQEFMLHTREDVSPQELQELTRRIQQASGIDLNARISSKPHLHFIATQTPPHNVLQAIREQGYDARVVDL